MQTTEWAVGMSAQVGVMHALCEKLDKSIRISIACSKEDAIKGIDKPHALGLPSDTHPIARILNSSIEQEQNTEYAVSMAGKLAKRCKKPVHVHYNSGDITVGELCDNAYLLALKTIITDFNL